MHNTQSTEAITLKSTPFEERGHILCLFSKKFGRISCVAKNKKNNPQGSFSPLLRIEAEVCISEKELWKCRQCEITNSFPKLRLALPLLRNAVSVTQFLSYSLPLHAPQEKLYASFDEYLTYLPLFKDPGVATTAFIAKFCLLEGLLGKCYPLSTKEAECSAWLAQERFEALAEAECEPTLLRKLYVVATR